jgi:uncharacterized protein DUF6431
LQKVCRAEGGVKSYLANPRCLLTDENRRCPICPDGHRLRLHGTYSRQALFPKDGGARCIEIHRLLCVRTGRTVSLLPDFCLPRRQHGPSILGLFLHAIICGAGQLEALIRVRPDATQHSTASSLLKGFLRKAAKIRAYLAGLRPRIVDISRALPRNRELALLVHGLLQGYKDPAAACTEHARRFHWRFKVGLA